MFVEFLRRYEYVPAYGIVAVIYDRLTFGFMSGDGFKIIQFQPGDTVQMEYT